MAEEVVGVRTVEGDLLALQQLLDSGLDTGCKMGLFKVSAPLGRNSVYADIAASEVTFTGYARQALTMGVPGVDRNGIARVLSDNVMFVADDPLTDPDVVGGAFLTLEDAGPPAVNRLLVIYQLGIPVPVSVAGQAIGAKAVITAPDLSGYAVFEV